MAEDISAVPTPAAWRDRPNATTPITAAALAGIRPAASA